MTRPPRRVPGVRRPAPSALLVLLAMIAAGPADAEAQERERDTSAAAGRARDAERRAAIDAGAPLVVAEEVPRSRWPRVTVTLFVDATPEEAAAVFADYGRHARFLPDVTRSRVARTVDSATAEVDYTLRVPLLPDEAYTVRDRLESETTAPGQRTYRVSWALVRASSTKAADGEARFEPYHNERLGRDGTLLTYRNLVVPGSRLAGLGFVRARAQRQVEETARAVATQVARERSGDRALLAAQLALLRRAVGGGP